MDPENADKRPSSKAANGLTTSTKQGRWGERVMVLRPFDEFWKEMEPELSLAILGPRRSGFALSEKEEAKAKQAMHRLRVPLEQFQHALYGIAEFMIRIKNDLALLSIGISEVRRLGKSFDRSLRNVRESKKLLAAASTIAKSEVAPYVNGGIPEFARTFNALERLERRLSRLRSAVAATLPPKERKTPKERNFAEQSPWKLTYEIVEFTKSIRALEYTVVYMIECALAKFDQIGFSSHGVDQIIARFFYLANNGDVEETPRQSPSEENIKLMRHNLRTGNHPVPKWLSDEFPPPSRYKKRSTPRKYRSRS